MGSRASLLKLRVRHLGQENNKLPQASRQNLVMQKVQLSTSSEPEHILSPAMSPRESAPQAGEGQAESRLPWWPRLRPGHADWGRGGEGGNATSLPLLRVLGCLCFVSALLEPAPIPFNTEGQGQLRSGRLWHTVV